MAFRLIPRDDAFFPLFDRAASTTVACADKVEALLNDPAAGAPLIGEIDDLERLGDEITRDLVLRLDKVIIAPFDREDIHGLAGHFDDTLDEMRAAADLVALHRVDGTLEELREQARHLVAAARVLERLTAKLRNLRDTRDDIDEIYRIESEADAAYRRSVARLFSGEFDALSVLRWKDVIEAIERAVNGIESAAHTIEEIVLKHA
jgi:uncharacterized protein